MKKVKRMIGGMALAAVLVINAGNVSAQAPAPAQGQAQDQGVRGDHEKMKQALNLSDDQVAKIKAIRQEARQKMQALKDDKTKDRAAFKDQRKAIRDDEERKVEALLNKDQLAKYQQMKEQRKAERQNRRGGK